jgi:hypothetical protein
MMDYRCGKCRSDLPSGETVCGVCFFDNQPTVTIHPYKPAGKAECFVCKMPLIEWKCMTPNCPKNKDNHTNDTSNYTQPAVIDHYHWRNMFNAKAQDAADAFSGVYKDPLPRSNEDLIKKMNQELTNNPLKPGLGKISIREEGKASIKSDGGPSTYFDLCNGGTLNDELERKGDEQWLGDSFHLGNVVKLAWRWGIKEGTDKAYDANKLIYSGARLLMKYKGVAAVRKSLQKLLDDPQFQEREKDK